MTSDLPYDPHPDLHEGMMVEVIRGPLHGVRGFLLRQGEAASFGVGCAASSAGSGGDRHQRCGANLNL